MKFILDILPKMHFEDYQAIMSEDGRTDIKDLHWLRMECLDLWLRRGWAGLDWAGKETCTG